MTTKPTRLLVPILAAALTFSACTDDAGTDTDAAPDSTPAADVVAADDTAASDEAATGSTEDEDESSDASPGTAIPVADLDPDVATMVSNIGLGYEQVDGVWKGFVPNEHPAIIVRKDTSNQLVGAVAFNHPEPEALGNVTAVDAAGLPFRSVHLVTDPTDAAAMDALEGFDFHAKLGGVDSFAMVAVEADDFFDPTSKDYVSTLLHEMFHRYQNQAFQQMAGQDIEGYAYTAENLELAVLEERALHAAVTATTDEAREAAASHFAAIRQTRLAADPRVELDDSQETFEGSARYIEHRLSDDSTAGYLLHGDNYDVDLVTNFDLVSGIKETFGFGRWYASGAAIFRLLDLAGVDDVVDRVEAGASPAEVLAAELGITETERAALVAEAKENYDPLGELAAQAAEAAEAAATEPAVFGDEGGFTGGDAEGDGAEGDGAALTNEELACLVEQGVDLEGEEIAVSDAQWEACIA